MIYLGIKALCPPSTGSGNRGEVCADRALGWRGLTESCRTERPMRTGSRRAGEGSYAPGQVQGHDAPCPSPRGDRHSPMFLLRCFPTRLLDSSLPLRNANLPQRQEGGRLHPKTQALRCVCPWHPTPASAPSTLQCHSHGAISAPSLVPHQSTLAAGSCAPPPGRLQQRAPRTRDPSHNWWAGGGETRPGPVGEGLGLHVSL